MRFKKFCTVLLLVLVCCFIVFAAIGARTKKLLRERKAIISQLEASGVGISSFWVTDDPQHPCVNKWINLNSLADGFRPPPRGVNLSIESDLSAIRKVPLLGTVERATLVGIDFRTDGGKAILDALTTVDGLNSLSILGGVGFSGAKEQFRSLSGIHTLAIAQPKANDWAPIFLAQDWRQLTTLLVIDSEIHTAEIESIPRAVSDLRMALCRFELGSFGSLARLSGLQRLSLFKTEIPDFDTENLATHTKLEELELTQLSLTDDQLARLVSRLPALKTLVIPNDWSDQRLEAVCGAFPNLAVLRSSNQIATSFWNFPHFETNGIAP